jgi:hypothetical protein
MRAAAARWSVWDTWWLQNFTSTSGKHKIIRRIGKGKMMEEEIHGGTEGKKIPAQGGRVRNSKVPEKRCEVVIVRA